MSRTRRGALELGMWNFDSGARALLGPNWAAGNVEQARAAVSLAPDLPASRMALARSIWLQGDSFIGALRTVGEALFAIPRHIQSSLWFSGNALYVLAIALIAGGLLAIFAFAAFAFRHASHDFADLLSISMPNFARAGLLGAVLLIPAVSGQGVLGLALGCLIVGVLYGTARQCWVLGISATVVLVGAFPVAQLAGVIMNASAGSPVLQAAIASTEGLAMPVDLQRLEAASGDDPLAAAALAATAKRAGSLGDAATAYQGLLEMDPENGAVANNAANVKLAQGQMDSALELYDRGSKLKNSAVLLFNLSQAYGLAFLVDDLNRTLAAAQQLDGNVIGELTQLQGSDPNGFTVDLPLERKPLWKRILHSSSGAAMSAELRSIIAPGILGQSWQIAAGAFFLAALVSLAGGVLLRASRCCSRCGRRLCPRCDPESGGEKVCEGCTRLFQQSETTDRARRVSRINALQERQHRLDRLILISSILLPGSAGLFAQRYWAVLVGSITAALAITALVYRNGVVPDPLIAGAAAPVAFGIVAAAAAITYAISVAMSLAARRHI